MKPRKREPGDDALDRAPDEILAQRAADGDDAAFESLVRRYGPLMRAYTARIVGSSTEADDVVQDALYNAWRRLPELRDPAAVKPWLMRIAGRGAFTYLRNRPATVPLPEREPALPDDTQPENRAVRRAQLTALSVAVNALPEDQRKCWLLREVAELTYDEIAAELDLPRASVRGRLARARASIYAQMEGWR